MQTFRWMNQRISRLRGAAGYTMVEMAIAIGVAVVVGMGIYAIFNSSQRASLSQKIYNDAQTSCSFALDQMKGELLLAGYRAVDQQRPISNAASNTVTFEYYDDNARDEAPYATGYDNNTQVTYKLVAGDLIREFKRHIPGGAYDAANVTSQKLAPNIAALSFNYFAGDNAAWNGADVKDIRTVRVSLTCNAGRPDPNTHKTSQITLTAEVRARNAGVASTPTDTIPPATPTGLISWDPGQCGTLQLRWDANTEADLDGYTLFYGLATGAYSERIVLARAPKTAGQYEYYTVTGLDSSVTGVTPQPRYYFAISSYDKSGNISPGLSTETSGNPTPSARTAAEVASYGTDTTVTPLVPAAPVGFTATPGNTIVTLAWMKSPATGLLGYRLYRSKTSASFTPDDTPITGNRIADENTLNQDVVSYTDNGLLGCTTYYYKLAAIACDTAIPIASLQFASVAGVPTDNVRPSSPELIAKPGYKRIILNLKNPTLTGTDADFIYTKIWYSTAGYPTMNEVTGVVSDGTLIPDRVPYPGTDGAGVIRGTGTIWPPINFNSTSNGDPGYTMPALIACTNQAAIDAAIAAGTTVPECDPITYYFLAVAYDQCLNHNEFATYSISEGTQCGDCNVDETCYGAPPAPTNLTPGGCSSTDGIRLTWDAYDVTTYRDLAGFHVWRCEGLTCASGGEELTQGTPTWFTSIIDTSGSYYPVVDGVTYSYRIEAADCYYERRATVSAAERAANNPDDNSASTTINALSVGQIDRDTTAPQIISGYLQASTLALPFTESAADGLTSVPPTFLHNTVTLWTKNTAASALTMKQFTASWDNTDAYLQLFAFGDGNTTPVTIGWKDTTLPLTHSSTGSAVTIAANSRFLALDDRVPIVTLFKNTDGSVTRATDIRQDVMRYTLNYRNDSTSAEGCGVTGLFYVPLGPYLYGTTQDQPSAGTTAWPIPGDQGSNAMNAVIANGGTKVTVYTNVFDASGFGISAVKLYYYVDSGRTLTAAPALSPTAQYPNLAPYTAIDLVHVAGNQWRTPSSPTDNRIPMSDGSNVWYFIVAVGNQGNFDREPEIGSGAFQYYQQPADICATTPNAPSLAGSDAGSNVILTWAAPTTNTSGSAYTDGQGYKVYRSRDAGGWSLLTQINDKNILTYTDAPSQIGTYTYRYYVTVFDQCTPTAKESVASAIYTEMVEDPCNTTPNPPVLSGSTDSGVSSVTLTWTAPTTNTSGTPCNDLAGYRIWKKVDLGAWTMIATTTAATLTYTDSGLANLQTVDYSYYVTAYDTCSTPSAKESAASNTYVDQYIMDPCSSIPGLPSNLIVTSANSTTGVTLSWTAPTAQAFPVGWPYNDPGGFYLYRGEWQGGSYTNGVFLAGPGLGSAIPASSTSYTDASAAALVGTVTYAYWIEAVDSCGVVSDWLYPQTLETYSDPCLSSVGATTGLAVTAADDTGVSLSWSAPSPNPGDLAGYEIERKNGAAGAWAQITGSPLYGGATTIKDTVTDAGTNVYFYRVRAFDSCATPNFGAYSSEAQENYTFVDPCTPVPTTPALAVTSVTSENCSNKNTNLSVSWNGPDPTATLFYRIYRCYTTNAVTTPTCTSSEVYTTTEPPSPAQTTKTASIGTGDVKPSDYRIWVWVEAVSAPSGCTSANWKTLLSAPQQDACSP